MKKTDSEKKSEFIPIHSIVYIIVNSAILSIALTLLTLSIFFNIYTIDAYYLIVAIIGSLGLLLTALASLKDWNLYLNDLFLKKNKSKEE